MGNTQILQIISIIYLVLGLGIFINPKYHSEIFKNLIEDKSSSNYLYGFLGLILGYLLINFTGKTVGWFTLIPIFGWLAIIKSVLFFLAPKALMGFAKIFTKKKEYMMFIALFITIFGAILSYVSFFVL